MNISSLKTFHWGWVLLLLFCSPASSETLPALLLHCGQRYPLEGLLSHEYQIQHPQIARVEETSEGLTLIALAPGKTSLQIKVNEKPLLIPISVKALISGTKSEIPEIRKIPGVKILSQGGKTFAQGEITSRESYQKILRMKYLMGEQLILGVEPIPGIKASLLEQSLIALRNQKLEGVLLAAAGHRFFLYGSVKNPLDVEQAFELVHPILPTVENRLPIPLKIEPTISVKVFLLELSRKGHKVLGLSWPKGIQNLFEVSPLNYSFSPSWNVSLHHLTEKGLARVLAEPLLSVRLGSKAELTAGGEIPIRLTEKFENKLIWKHYGLKLSIEIAGISGKHIRTKIETESSQLDSSSAIGGTPGIKSNHLKTEIDAEEGEPILLTGLFQSFHSKDMEALPFLSDIPILGELFKSRDFRNNESELLVALLPEVQAVKTSLPLKGVHLDYDESQNHF